jgi:hypothetical protein
MRGLGFLIQVLPVLVIVFGMFLYVLTKLTKRFKPVSRAGVEAGRPSTGSGNAAGDALRSAKRIECLWPARVESGGRQMEALLVTLGLAGAFVNCRRPLPVGRALRILIADPPGRSAPIALTGTVTWNNAGVADEEVVHRGMGVRFVDLSETDRRSLDGLIEAFSSHNTRPQGG